MAETTLSPDVDLRLREITTQFSQKAEFLDCIAALKRKQPATFDSVWGSSCALLVAALKYHFTSVLVVVPEPRELDNLYDDLGNFSWQWKSAAQFADLGHSPSVSAEQRVLRFPARVAGMQLAGGVDLEYGDRLRLIKELLRGGGNEVVIATVGALLQPVPQPASLSAHSRWFRPGNRLDLNELRDWLLGHGFHQTTAVELPGEFSMRGGIVDLFSPDNVAPVRIELFDDEIESIRQFDGATQRSQTRLAELEVSIIAEGEPETGSLLDYLPADTVVLLHEPEKLQEQAVRYLQRSENHDHLFSWEDVQQQWARFSLSSANGLAAGELGVKWSLPIDGVESFSGDLGDLRSQVERLGVDSLDHAGQGGPADVIVLARVEGELPRVREILGTTQLANSGRLHLGVGVLHSGFRIRDSRIVLVGCDQIFHRTDLRRRGRKRLSKAIDSFLDLREGDLVVHLAHGIGRFRGMQILEKEGEKTEHLLLEFFGGTKIFVPATKIDLVQKYVGGTKTQPMLAKIGGKTWARQKASVESAVMDLAAEMIEIQAARETRPGISFAKDSEWQIEFEQSFPYHETPDQLTAIEMIKEDMQRPQPMDRLLCGDVGFGKTEVAMRAAFKAVDSGYQVAVLVPTTVLAEQHYKNFVERMGEFPVEIGKLSRFCSSRDIKQTLEKLKQGQIDICIGTHRLVSRDVRFHKLGLVIIDEEQRFGVEHKERLKRLKSDVDLLTLSATPIPRTLHMSLVGVRNISNLETPPEERTRVETKVLRFNEELIRTAILRELNRGGQVFFVHNRVGSIFAMKDRLMELVPEASFVVGHGQMDEKRLEKAMTDFIAHKYDVLLATTIIESGLDIPNANTIFIDRADRYGLADLHQLRGRVGRYKNQAFCYLLLDPHQHINPTAAKRLQAIETFSQMGAGFAISMRDLEIRGAGNLLGTEQSGHIATVGYELYCQMLERAVRHLKHQPQKLGAGVEIDLPVSAFLPDEYVADRRQKIDLYRRLTRLENFQDVDQIRAEMRDRFGKLPVPAERLLKLAYLKLEAALWQIASIHLQDKYLVFKFRDRQRFSQLIKIRPMIRLIDDHTAMVTLKSLNFTPEKMLALIKSLLQPNP
jgi:transcription-repair coupling factor (superfamily II helicase)